MRTKVRIIKTDYIVNLDKEVVVCKLKVDMQLYKHPTWPMLSYQILEKLHPVDSRGIFEVQEIARCSKEDVFRIEKGKRIAESRAKRKAFVIAKETYKKIENYLLRQVERVSESRIACENALSTERAHVKSLIQ